MNVKHGTVSLMADTLGRTPCFTGKVCHVRLNSFGAALGAIQAGGGVGGSGGTKGMGVVVGSSGGAGDSINRRDGDGRSWASRCETCLWEAYWMPRKAKATTAHHGNFSMFFSKRRNLVEFTWLANEPKATMLRRGLRSYDHTVPGHVNHQISLISHVHLLCDFRDFGTQEATPSLARGYT